MPSYLRMLAAGFVLMALLAAAPQSAAAQQTLTVFAAASMKNTLDEVNAAFTAASGLNVVASFAATSALAKQIELGAPADIFLSADEKWMDYAAGHKLINLASRFDLLGNRLVLIAPAGSRFEATHIEPRMDLASLAGDGRIATGDVQAVPVGRYAKAALTALGIWEQVEPKLVMTENVRAALTLVARREATLGIVYETDAKIEPKVKIIGFFPDGFVAPIIYPVAMTTDAAPSAHNYLEFLRTAAARAIFERHGFTCLAKPSQ